MGRNYTVDLENFNYAWVRIIVRTESTREKLQLSRAQIGLLFLFSFVSEVTRSEVREYFIKIGVSRAFQTDRKNVHQASISRMVKLSKDRELLVEINQRLYRTFKGQAVLMGVMHCLSQEAIKIGVPAVDIQPWIGLFQSKP